MFRKVKGSALQFAILISVLIFISLGAFLLLTYSYSTLNDRTANLLKNIYDAEEIIVTYSEGKKNRNEKDQRFEKSYWGSFEKVHSKTGKGVNSFSRAALIGSEIAEKLPVLYLEDQNMPLVVAGNTIIKGDAYIPDEFVKPGSVSGEYFQGSTLVNGRLYKSEKKLPKLEETWLKYVDSIFTIKSLTREKLERREIQNSFLNENKSFGYRNEIIDLVIRGNVIIFCPYPVVIKKLASIDQALIIAPKISVEEDFNGSLHAITSYFESGKNCHFEYPSSVTTLSEDDNKNTEDIIIGEGTMFEGNIISLDRGLGNNNLVDVKIEENSQITGFVYCQGSLEFYGEIEGSLYSENVITSEKGSKYLNHLFNCKITNENLPNAFGGPLLKDSNKTIASWLY